MRGGVYLDFLAYVLAKLAPLPRGAQRVRRGGCRVTVGERLPQNNLAASGPHRFRAHPGQDQARQVAKGELVATRHRHIERVRAVDALVLKPVAGLLRGKLHSAIVRAMKPLSGSASLALTSTFT